MTTRAERAVPVEDATSTPGGRPVTPVSIAASLVAGARSRLEQGAAEESVHADLARAESLLTGIDPYCAAMTAPPSAGLDAVAHLTASVDWAGRGEGSTLEAEMLSGHVEGALLGLLVRLVRAHDVLEVGMFTGYSALAMAEQLPAAGRVVACEIDHDVADYARQVLPLTVAGERIRVEVGPALDTLHRLADDGEQFDLVFVDADKPGYADYVATVLDLGLLRVGGLLVLDNTLMQGEPWSPGSMSANGRAIAEANEVVRTDSRLTGVLLPLRDGVTLAVREAG